MDSVMDQPALAPIAVVSSIRGIASLDLHLPGTTYLLHFAGIPSLRLAQQRVTARYPDARFVDGTEFYDEVQRRTGQDPTALERRPFR